MAYRFEEIPTVDVVERAKTVMRSAVDPEDNTIYITAENDQKEGYVEALNATAARSVSVGVEIDGDKVVATAKVEPTSTDDGCSINTTKIIPKVAVGTPSLSFVEEEGELSVQVSHNQSEGYVEEGSSYIEKFLKLGEEDGNAVISLDGVTLLHKELTPGKLPDIHMVIDEITHKVIASIDFEESGTPGYIAHTASAVKELPLPTEEKTVTPTDSEQTITPSSGKLLSKVVVNAIPRPATCTITFKRSAWNYDICIGYTKGSGIPAYVNAPKGTSAVTISNVVCDSMIAIYSSGYLGFETSPPYVYGKSNFGIYKAPATSAAYTYTLIDD